MLDTSIFVDRIETIIKYYGLSPSSFADKIGVNRATITHITSGRNKPSLDVILKIIKSFKEVRYDWLLDGKGTFPATNTKQQQTLLNFTKNDSEAIQKNIPSEIQEKEPKKKQLKGSSKNVEQIIICYDDGSFKVYQ